MHDKSENVCLCVCVFVHGEKKSGQESDRGLTFVCTDTKPLLMNVIYITTLLVCVCVCIGVYGCRIPNSRGVFHCNRCVQAQIFHRI